MGTILIKYSDLIKPSFQVWGTFQGSRDTRCHSRMALLMWRFRHILTLSIQFFNLREQIVSQQTAELPRQFFLILFMLCEHSETFFLCSTQFFNHKNKKESVTSDCGIATSQWHTFWDVLFALHTVIWSQNKKERITLDRGITTP